MRILILMGLHSPWSRATASMLARLGHEVHIVDFDETKGSYLKKTAASDDRLKAEAASISLLAGFGASNFRYFAAAPQFRRILKQVKPEILLTLYAGGYAQLAWLSSFRPYAVFAVGSDILLQRGLRKQMARVTLEAAAHVFANGKFLAQKTQEMAPRARVTPLLLGIDTQKFQPSPKPPQVELLCNRGFRFPYNNEAIIEALARLDDTPPFTFHFASSGPELEQAKALAKKILPPAILESVIFWGGVNDEQMLDLLARCRCFVSMSRSDGTATSLLEAMACGLFPILSDIPQNVDWVDPTRRNGRIVPLDSVDQLADALREAIRNPAHADAAAAYNREQMLNLADARANLSRLAQTLSETARKQP